MRRPRHRRTLVASVVATLAMVLGLFAALAPSATAGPVEGGWAATGPGLVTTVSDGSLAAAAMTYNSDNQGAPVVWTFTTTATTESATGPIRVPWTWQGLHAWFMVTAKLEMTVNGVVVGTLLDTPPTSCCETPSNGFLYGGVAEFTDAQVNPGDVYGFRLTGSNADFNNLYRGTFTLSNKPYLDATIGQDNRQWIGAADLPLVGAAGFIEEPGEARWFRFPVVPGQTVGVNLSSLPADYDLALYGDIGAAFERLSNSSDLTQLAAASAAGAPGSETQVPTYPDSIQTVPTSSDTVPTATFAPRIYAPRIYAPRIYAPRIYAPRIYAPRIYAPRIYAPDAYTPDLEGNPAFRDAFTAAQNQSLLVLSANTGTDTETVTANTGNTDGFFYVRVQGHNDTTFDAADSFQLTRTTTGGEACAGLDDFSGTPSLGATRADADTVIVTDTNKLRLTVGEQPYLDYRASLSQLAAATDGAVVDVRESERVRLLQAQVTSHPTCPYASNLVARAIQDIVESYRNSESKYVVIAGGDEVIPFFRYPDTSGLGQESQFEPPMLPDSPAGASLANDQVLGQDAYGSATEITIGGSSVPVPDLAVGRLVKTPDEIRASVAHFLGLPNGRLPAPTSSLVTGYDFLEDAAKAVNEEFVAAVPGGTHDTLIEEAGTPHIDSWTGDDLADALLDDRHSMVYLAGHFSANDTLAADFTTTFEADEIDPAVAPGALTDTIVLSAGCHSGYSIVDLEADPTAYPVDWTQRMAQQHAVLIGGTGYQYGDTDFLEYSERLYLQVAKRLREGPANAPEPRTPVAVGRALALAKQDYLATLSTLTGIDQKAVLQATLYGLPMVGFDAPGRAPLGTDASPVVPVAATTGPGATLGLSADDVEFDTPTTVHDDKPSGAEGFGLPATHRWLDGNDGVTVQPGAPALPKQVENVTVAGQVLRGVGFRSGTYADTGNVLPLTGAPAIEGSTANTTFESTVFFPQRLATANYFGALGDSGRTSLVLSPAQYRNDPSSTFEARTNVERRYSKLGVRLFYSGPESEAFGENQPALAAPPSIGEVDATVLGNQVTFSARVNGDPSAGVQQVWVTWTGAAGSDAGHGTWASVDLSQVPNDSSRWTGTLDLPAGQTWQGVRFLVQAVNGVGALSLDTAEGDGYRVREAGVVDPGSLTILTGAPGPGSPLGVTALVTGSGGQPLPGRTVVFTVSRAGTQLSTYADVTDGDGRIAAQVDGATPSGRLEVRIDLYDLAGLLVDSETTQVVLDQFVLTTPASLSTRAGTVFAPGLSATLSDKRGGVAGVPVTFTIVASAAGATFPGGVTTTTVTTDASGHAEAPTVTANPTVGAFKAVVSAEFADDMVVPMASQYALTPFEDPVDNSGTLVRNANANTPIATAALLADGTRLSDSGAAALVQARRVQVRWRELGTELWSGRNDLATYDAAENLFRANLKGPSLGLLKGRTYTVEVRILPAPTDVRPAGEVLQNTFDLGHRSFTISLR